MTTISGRKVRADAKLEQLNETQQAWLHFWFEENLTYHEIVKLLHQHCGLSVGKSAVGAYYRRHVLSVQLEEESEVVATLAALPAADFDKAALQRAKALLWAAVADIHPDVELAAKLSVIIDRVERRALAGRKLDLEERKVVVREKLAELKTKKEVARELRELARSQRQDLEPRATRKDTKGSEGSEGAEESAGVVGRNEGAEMAAKALRNEGRSEATGAANLSGEAENSPRFAGYSEVRRAEAEAEVARELRESARIPRQDEEPTEGEKMKEKNREIGKQGAAKESAGEVTDAELDTWSLIQRIRERAERREQEIREMEEDMARDGK